MGWRGAAPGRRSLDRRLHRLCGRTAGGAAARRHWRRAHPLDWPDAVSRAHRASPDEGGGGDVLVGARRRPLPLLRRRPGGAAASLRHGAAPQARSERCAPLLPRDGVVDGTRAAPLRRGAQHPDSLPRRGEGARRAVRLRRAEGALRRRAGAAVCGRRHGRMGAERGGGARRGCGRGGGGGGRCAACFLRRGAHTRGSGGEGAGADRGDELSEVVLLIRLHVLVVGVCGSVLL
mmetsp:Transcript_45401/g.146120  ORF Transcript_45401/g.146120 Transcript_45401/m.146120 type:complete len:234 (+) Transcript_45401:332-1033(+)